MNSLSTNSPENEGRRKRTKTSTPPNNASACSLQDLTNDDLNAAIHSSVCFDDDSFVETQIGVKQNNPRKSLDKENSSNFQLTNISTGRIDERSPTILSRYPMKSDPKLVTPDRFSSPVRRSDSIGSSTIKSKSSAAKKGTPRRLFTGWVSPSTSKKSPTPPQIKPNIVPKRKFINLSLSSNTNTTRMKQSTINFPPKVIYHRDHFIFTNLYFNVIFDLQQTDETFFESLPTQKNNEINSSEPSTINMKGGKDEQANARMYPSNSVEDDLSSSSGNNSVIEIKKDANELINIDESESSQEFYVHVHDIKRELDLPTQFNDSDNQALKSDSTRTNSLKTQGGCHDCNMVSLANRFIH